MRLKYGLIFILFFPFFTLFAQLDPQYSFFPWTQPFFNPATIGEKENHLNFIGVLRQSPMREKIDKEAEDYNNNNNDPNNNNNNNEYISHGQQQVLLMVDSYIKKIRGAVGITFLSDIIDGHNFIDFRLGYAQKFRIRNGKLSVGLQLGLLNKTPRSELNPAESGDPLLLHKTEPFLDFDMNFGLFYKTPTWYVGVSSTKLLESVRVSGSEFSSLHNARQFYISGGYIWNLKTAVPWTIEPSVLIHSEIASWRLHLMALARYNGILWFGLSYQHNNAIAVLLGATPFYNSTNEYLKGLEMGIAYGFDTKKTGWQKGGTWGDFEIVVRYGFNFYKEKSLTGYGSSRHLYKNQY